MSEFSFNYPSTPSGEPQPTGGVGAMVTNTSIDPSIYWTGRPMLGNSTVDHVKDAARRDIQEHGINDELAAKALYGSDGGEGGAQADYGPQMSQFFDARQQEARGAGDHDEVAALDQARTATNEAFRFYQVGGSRAAEIMGLAHRYEQQPLDDASRAVAKQVTLSRLQDEFGSRTPQLLDAAQKISSDLCRRIPNFARILENGLGNAEPYVRSCINAARKKGYI